MKVTLITCTISIGGRWAVAAIAGAHDEVDLPVMRDPRGKGQPHLPGSSLAGSLRQHLGDKALEWLGSDIRGFEDRPAEDEPTKASPGKLRLLGTRPIEAAIDSRGVTAVDRRRGAALPGALRTEESASQGDVVLAIEHDGQVDMDLLNSLGTWSPVIGRSRSTGLGSARVTAVEAVTIDLTHAEQLTWWLGKRTAYLLGKANPPEGVTPSQLDANVFGASGASSRAVELTVREPIHIGIHDAADEVRLQTTVRLRGGAPFVPGSSWKGVFRHRVAFILDAVGADEQQRNDIVEALFGGPRLRRGLLTFADSPIDVQTMDKRTHVAIDRFTGGARDGALFTLESVPRGSALTLTVAGGDDEPIKNLLNHVLRDMSDGLIGVGGSGTRGYGWVECPSDELKVCAVKVEALHGLLAPHVPQREAKESAS